MANAKMWDMSQSQLAKRVAALEAEVDRLKRQIEAPGSWERIIGTFANDPLYERAMKYGREYRESLRPDKSRSKGQHGRTRH
jgi:hypothetical protein